MAVQQVDLVDRVRSLVGEAASVKGSYGGLEVIVRDNGAFPWGQVMDVVTTVGQDVWVVRRDGNMVIRSKPPAV